MLMTTVTVYPRNDIRSMFKTNASSSLSSLESNSLVSTAPPHAHTPLHSKDKNKKEKKSPTKKIEKKTEIDYLCDTYCKIIKNSKEPLDKEKIKTFTRNCGTF